MAWNSRRGSAPTRSPSCRCRGCLTPRAIRDQQVSLVDAARDPVTCAYWSKPAGAATSSLSLLSGSALPVPDAVRTLDLVGAGSGSQGAARVALAPGTGYFAQTVGGGASAPAAGSLFWVSDTGVRYGIDNEADNGPGAAGHGKTVEALGLSAPAVPIPWSMLSLFAAGPTLSRADALLAHDGLAPDTRPGRAGVGRRRTPMSRLIFEARRRLAPPTTRKGTITIEAPPELPRVIPPSLLRRAMPVVIVILIVGMIVALVATGMRVISPQTLFFPFVLLLAATALYRGNDNKMRTEEVDAERADYLRYLSVVRDNIRTQAAEQRAAAQWSHPDPTALAAVPGSRRQWERDPHDPDFLVLRAGRHHVPLATALRVKDTADEIDLEPVSHSALRSLLDTQRTVRDVPTGIDLTKVSRITVLGEADEVRAALRAWIAQAVTWHDPTVLGVALATPRSGEPGLVLAEVVAARRHSRRARRCRPGALPVDRP